MVDELKPLQFGLAIGIVAAVVMFFMGLTMRPYAGGYGYYGMMGMMGGGNALVFGIYCLVMGFLIGLIGGGAVALLYNYFVRVIK